MRQGLLGIEGMDRQEIESVLSRARDFQPDKDRASGEPIEMRQHT